MLSTEWWVWLVQGMSHELMLFAAVGVLLIGLDDLYLDAIWLGRGGLRRRAAAAARDMATNRHALSGPDRPFAILVPAWQEAEVLPVMVAHALAQWRGESFRLYIGCYPNDPATMFAVSRLVAQTPELRLVIGREGGPTTKADNLNRLWAALQEDEAAEGIAYAGIVLHDAEDVVHGEELALYRRYLGSYAMVQIPVVPLTHPHSHWISGHYCDEFAEAHGKEMVLRSALGMPLPSAGVGCALSPHALLALSMRRRGAPFQAESLTEDYELGMVLAEAGMPAIFVDERAADGSRIVSRGLFPAGFEAAIRQKARWIAGVALVGWDRIGWHGGSGGSPFGFGTGPTRAHWMLWRDRRAPFAALVLLTAYAAMLLWGIDRAGGLVGWWAPRALPAAMGVLLSVNAVLLGWRLAMRFHFTARCYGPVEGLRAIPRTFVSNVMAMLAARRAIPLYVRMLRSRQPVWDKTAHEFPAAALITDPARRP